jgi:hypothetical protein
MGSLAVIFAALKVLQIATICCASNNVHSMMQLREIINSVPGYAASVRRSGAGFRVAPGLPWSPMGEPVLVRSVKRAMLAGGDLPIVSANAPRSIPGIDFSDHLNYWALGYPAVMLTDTAFYRNPNYHAVGDMPDTLDYQRMAKLVDQIESAVMYLAR